MESIEDAPWFSRFFLLVVLGIPSLQTLFQMSEKEDHKEWNELRQRLTNRVTVVNVVSSLFITVTASYLTSPPPTTFVTWHHKVPYIFIGAASACAVLAVFSGFGLYISLNAMRPETLRERPLKLCAILMLLIMPLAFLFLAMVCAVVGWTAAIWFGDVAWLKLAVSFGFVVFVMIQVVIIIAIY